ncbi:MAG: SusC/RagA family TonB-linked outer membrane protein, partial [Prevotella sp.]|nr:SusC/RagA family TonB-linked outer membrane protein [Prevotella sp.]
MKIFFFKRIAIFIAVLAISVGIFSQVNPGQVSGLVTDGEENPLIGVSIKVKGTKTGTVSDFDGRYQINISSEADVLIFSYVGFAPKEIAVGNNKTLNVVLQDEHNALDEVVVTALGIKREKKALGYAVQDIKGDVLTEVRDPNMLNSLAGQVAGVQISNSASGGLGGSPKISIRGDISFTNSAPLFVIDGVPLNNNSSNYNTDGMDFGSGAADINPDDVESMSVLKGPTAAALYGSRAANGAVVITTKSGKKNKGLGITYNSNLVIQPRLLRTPNYQYKYGAGENFEYSYVDGNGGGINDGAGYCWGPKLNQLDPSTASGFVEIPQFASPIDPVTGARIAIPWVAHKNFLEDFFETGTVFTNNVSISNANENGSFRLSYTNLDQKGIMPNTDLQRNTVSLSAGYNLAKFLRVNANVNYVQNKSDNMPQLNYWDKPIMYTFMWWGMNEDVKALRNYWTPGKEGLEQTNYNNSWMDNPYFTLYENTQSQLKNHLYGNVSFTLDIIDGLSLMGRTGTDWYDDNIRIRRAYSSRNYPNGMYAVNNYIFQERNSDFLLTWDKPNESNFQYKISFGGNMMRRSIRKTAAKALELEIPGIYNLENARSTPTLNEENQEKAINSLYGMGQLVYKNMLYLDVTARNDWSSTLPLNNNSYFYPS